ncbi:MAG: type II secretion system protein [Vicinamibacterales bacterium]
MQLRGQHGYAMAALLVGMAVAAVLMTAVLPTWRQMVRREKEAELVFRGQQYVRAIALFQKKSGPGVLPPDLDTLVNGRFLRKKFKDPITNDDFDLLSPTQAAGGTGAQPAQGRGATSGDQPQTGRGLGAPATTGTVVSAQAGGRGGAGGVIGVASKSRDASIRVYNGRSRYNEWQFIFVQQPTPGAGGAGGQRGAGPGGRGGQPQAPQGGFQGGAPGGVQGIGGRQGGPGGQGRGNQPFPPGGRGFQTAPPSSPSPFGPR